MVKPGHVLVWSGLVALGLWLIHVLLPIGAFSPWVPPTISLELLELLEWQTVIGSVALAVFGVFVWVGTPSNPKLVDRFIGAFLLSNVALVILLAIVIGSLPAFYTGLKLVVVVGRLVLFLLVSLVTVWGFVFSRPWARWLALGTFVTWLNCVSWAPEPNSRAYIDLRQRLESTAQPQPSPNVTVTTLTYPGIVQYVSYAGIAVYAFIRHRLATRRAVV